VAHEAPVIICKEGRCQMVGNPHSEKKQGLRDLPGRGKGGCRFRQGVGSKKRRVRPLLRVGEIENGENPISSKYT